MFPAFGAQGGRAKSWFGSGGDCASTILGRLKYKTKLFLKMHTGNGLFKRKCQQLRTGSRQMSFDWQRYLKGQLGEFL